MALDPNINKIQFLRSNVPGATPALASLTEGEIAINMVDRKIFSRYGSNVIELGFGKGGTVDGNINQTSGNITSTGIITAGVGGFVGNISGNAQSASRLQTQRTFSLTGSATGSAVFDGTQNPSIAVNVNMVNAKSPYINAETDAPTTYGQGIQMSFVGDASWPISYGGLITARPLTNGGGTLQILTGYGTGAGTGQGKIMLRTGNYDGPGNDSWTPWKELVHSLNIGSFAVPREGIGTAAFNANSSTFDGVKTEYRWTNGPAGAGIGAMQSYRYSSDWLARTFFDIQNQAAYIQFQRNVSGNVVQSAWNKIAFEGSASGSASRLETPRNINGVAFDGTADITIGTARFATPLSSQGTANLNTVTDTYGVIFNYAQSGATGKFPGTDGCLLSMAYNSSYSSQMGIDWYTNDMYIRSRTSGTWGSWMRMLHQSNFNTYAPTLTGVGATGDWSINAATATKLKTPVTINDTSFDGSANITVSDTSKVPLAGGTMTGTLTAPTVSTPILDSSTPVAVKNGAAVQGIRVKDLLIGSTYDAASIAKVPLNGAYVKGSILTEGAMTITSPTAGLRPVSLNTNGAIVADGGYGSLDVRVLAPNAVKAGSLQTYFTSKGGMLGSIDAVYMDLITLNSYTDSSGGLINAIGASKSGAQRLYHYQATTSAGTWSAPKTIAYLDDINASSVASADKLTTPRTISITGNLNGSTTFDGSANVSIALAAGTAALYNTGTSGTLVPLLSGSNLWGGMQSFSNGVRFISDAYFIHGNGTGANWGVCDLDLQTPMGFAIRDNFGTRTIIFNSTNGNILSKGSLQLGVSNQTLITSDVNSLSVTALSDGTLKRVSTGGLLVSSLTADISKVPIAGIFSKGQIVSESSLSLGASTKTVLTGTVDGFQVINSDGSLFKKVHAYGFCASNVGSDIDKVPVYGVYAKGSIESADYIKAPQFIGKISQASSIKTGGASGSYSTLETRLAGQWIGGLFVFGQPTRFYALTADTGYFLTTHSNEDDRRKFCVPYPDMIRRNSSMVHVSLNTDAIATNCVIYDYVVAGTQNNTVEVRVNWPSHGVTVGSSIPCYVQAITYYSKNVYHYGRIGGGSVLDTHDFIMTDMVTGTMGRSTMSVTASGGGFDVTGGVVGAITDARIVNCGMMDNARGFVTLTGTNGVAGSSPQVAINVWTTTTSTV